MRSDDRHDWAEVLLNKPWRVVDTHARKFLADEDSYIAIMRLDTQGDRPLVGHQRYKVNNKAIRVQQF